jgi:hypothetical protein
MRTTKLLLTCLFALPATATAQRLAAYDLAAAAFTELQGPTALLPAPVGPVAAYPSVPPLPPVGPVALPPGDSTWNGRVGYHWFSNGAMLAAQPTPTFPPLGPVPAGPFPIAPAVLGVLGGAATGIALDTLANVMYLTGPGGAVVGVTPMPGTPVVVPPFLPAFPMGPITGLDYDQMTGTLLSVDAAGIVYRYLPGGAPVGPPVVPPFPLPAIAGDVAIDKSGQVNGMGVRPIYVVAGPMVVDVAAMLPMPFPAGPAGNVGLAYMGHPASNPPVGTCACPTFAPGPTQQTSSVMTAGNGAWRIGVGSLPPGQIVIFGFDFGFNPAFPVINTVGCGLGFWLGSPTLVTAAGFANAVGNAIYPFPLIVPPGFGPIYNQNFTFCPADASGFVVTPMQAIWASGL